MSGREKGARSGRRGCVVVVAALVVVALAVGGVYAHFGGFGTGPSADTDELARYAAPVSDIAIPEGARVVSLGEATHGNLEFQQLKLDVFKVLVERYGVRGFALEADAGGCERVNRYIHGGEGTLQDAVGNLVFTLYRTDQMAELISWMRAYNETAAPGQDLRFYGFDMQNYEHSYQLLLDEAHRLSVDATPLEALWSGDDYAEGVSTEQMEAAYAEVRRAIEALGNEEDTSLALHLVDCLLQNIELGRLVDSPAGYGARDRLMAQNVLWALAQEEARGNGLLFVSAHNGHIQQTGSYGPDDKVMGALLADELGDAYYAMGTDFFRATVNLREGDGERMTHTFYSYDPLAKAAANGGLGTCWLDFSRVPQDSSLRAYIDEPIMMGSVGEGFNALMYVLPQTYRVKLEPASPYDSMIIVAYATPTEIVEVTH